MEHILDETVPSADLKKFEQKYHEELQAGKVSTPVLIVVLTIPYKLKKLQFNIVVKARENSVYKLRIQECVHNLAYKI